MSVSSCSSRGRRKRHDEPRSGAGNHRPPPQLRRMACGVAPAFPQPNLLQSARPHAPRAPHLQAHQGCLVAESRLAGLHPDGVTVNRARARGLRQVPPLLHRVRPRSQEGRRTRMTGSRRRKMSGDLQDCGISNESTIIHFSRVTSISITGLYSVCIIFYNTSLPCLLCIAAFILSSPKIARYSTLLMGRDHERQ